MKYTITIKNNETGKVILDEQTDCIIGALDLEDTTKTIALSDANILDAMNCAIKAVETADLVIDGINGRIKEKDND